MSPRATSHRSPVWAVLALAVGATSLVGVGHASAGPAAASPTYAVTGVSPAYVEADVDDAFGITLTGRGFTRNTRVSFSACGKEGAAVAPASVSATKLVVRPPSCSPGLQDIGISEGTAKVPTATLPGRFTFLAKPIISVPTPPAAPEPTQPPATPEPTQPSVTPEPVLAPVTARAVTPGAAPWSGGTLASLDLVHPLPARAPVQVLFTTGGVTKAVPGNAAGPSRISFKVPAGMPGGTPDVAVAVFGVLSEPVQGQFEHVSTIKTSPAVWVKGAAAPTVKIDGAGFTGTADVTVCGSPATLVAGKTTTKTLVVTPPTWAELEDNGIDADTGGVCTVRVTVGDVVSTITAGSTFTYAAY